MFKNTPILSQHKTLYFQLEDSFNPLTITTRNLTHNELQQLDFYIQTEQFYDLYEEICKITILKIDNVVIDDKLTYSKDYSILPVKIINYIGREVYNLSKTSKETLEAVQVGIDIVLDKRFKKENWECEVCRKKRLDSMRNCGYLNEQDKDKSFRLVVNETVYTQCPIYFLKNELLNQALTCYSLYDKGLLPHSKGFYDQTDFFVITSKFIDNKIKDKEQRELTKK